MGSGKFNAMDLHLLVTLCSRNWDKLWPDGSLDLIADFFIGHLDGLYSTVHVPCPTKLRVVLSRARYSKLIISY